MIAIQARRAGLYAQTAFFLGVIFGAKADFSATGMQPVILASLVSLAINLFVSVRVRWSK